MTALPATSLALVDGTAGMMLDSTILPTQNSVTIRRAMASNEANDLSHESQFSKRWTVKHRAFVLTSILGMLICGSAIIFAVSNHSISHEMILDYIPDLDIPPTASESDRLRLIDQWLAELNAVGKFNGGVLVARGGQPLLMTTHGFTDHTASSPLSSQSSFRLGSISEQFTAIGALVLVDQGHLELDATVDQYLADFPYDEVTVRHLLQHSSGICGQLHQTGRIAPRRVRRIAKHPKCRGSCDSLSRPFGLSTRRYTSRQRDGLCAVGSHHRNRLGAAIRAVHGGRGV